MTDGPAKTPSPVVKALAAAAAFVVVLVAAQAVIDGNNDPATASSGAARALPRAGQAPPGAGGAPGVPGTQAAPAAPGAPGGPAGAPPGFGAPVTGSTLAKVEEAATAKYPGTVERAFRLPDGRYVVHVIQAGGEVHVLLSSRFKLLGADADGPGGRDGHDGPDGGGFGGQAPPSGQGAPATGTSRT